MEASRLELPRSRLRAPGYEPCGTPVGRFGYLRRSPQVHNRLDDVKAKTSSTPQWLLAKIVLTNRYCTPVQQGGRMVRPVKYLGIVLVALFFIATPAPAQDRVVV